MLWVGAECRHSSRPVKRQIFSVFGAYQYEISPVGGACKVKEYSSVQNQVFFRKMRRCTLSPFLRNTKCTQIVSYIFVQLLSETTDLSVGSFAAAPHSFPHMEENEQLITRNNIVDW